MKQFESPKIEILRFSVQDVITTSDNMLPITPQIEGATYSDELTRTKLG